MKTEWIDIPLPEGEMWGEYPTRAETGYIAFCPFGHQWWERISSPDHCPRCDLTKAIYQVNHRKATRLEWWWHLLREALRGTPVTMHAQYAIHMEDEEE